MGRAFASPFKAWNRGTATGLCSGNIEYMIGARPAALRSLGPRGPYTLASADAILKLLSEAGPGQKS